MTIKVFIKSEEKKRSKMSVEAAVAVDTKPTATETNATPTVDQDEAIAGAENPDNVTNDVNEQSSVANNEMVSSTDIVTSIEQVPEVSKPDEYWCMSVR